jgi:uncharacterized protein
MRPTKLLTTFCALCIFFSLTASAQVTAPIVQQGQADKAQDVSPEKQALVKELLVAMDVKKNADAVLNGMFEQMEKQMPEIIWQALSEMKETSELTPTEQQHLRDEISASAIRTSRRFRELLAQRINFVQMTEKISSVLYAKYFSENELRDLVAFYNSSTGRRTMEIMPNLVVESMTRANERIMPVVKDLMSEISSSETTRLQTEITALAKSHHKAATPRSKSRQTRPKAQ